MDDSGSFSIEQLEGVVWPQPPEDATRLMRSVFELRRRPIRELTPEDLRVLLGQGEGVAALLPHALRLLGENPLTEGDCYPGDLLVATLGIATSFWRDKPEYIAQLRQVIEKVEAIGNLDDHYAPHDDIWEAIESSAPIQRDNTLSSRSSLLSPDRGGGAVPDDAVRFARARR
ncbi:contact-dependent growth inhibition system immunity protein [Nocardia brasiliensis]